MILRILEDFQCFGLGDLPCDICTEFAETYTINGKFVNFTIKDFGVICDKPDVNQTVLNKLVSETLPNLRTYLAVREPTYEYYKILGRLQFIDTEFNFLYVRRNKNLLEFSALDEVYIAYEQGQSLSLPGRSFHNVMKLLLNENWPRYFELHYTLKTGVSLQTFKELTNFFNLQEVS